MLSMNATYSEQPKSSLWPIFTRAIVDLFRAAPVEASLLALVLIVQGILPAFNLYLTKITVDGVTKLTQGGNIQIILIVLAWSVSMITNVVLAPLNQVLQGNVAEKFTAHVNLSLMGKTETLPGLDLLEDSRFHDDLKLLQEGAKNRPLNVLVLLVFALRDIITLISFSGILILIGWWVPLIVFLTAYPEARMTLKLREVGWNALMSRTPEARSMDYESRIALSHQYAAEVRLYRLIPWLRNRYQIAFNTSHATMRKVRAQQAIQVLPTSFFSVAISICLFAWAVIQAARGELTVGEIVVIVGGLTQVQQTVFSLIEGSGMIFERGLYFKKYFDFLSATPLVTQPIKPKTLPLTMPSIAFDNVCFDYPDGRKALQNVTFAINPGEVVAIVGENGAGKSTIIKLLLRYYDVTDGRIEINNIDVRDLDVNNWRDRVSAVFQDFGRYSYTVRENIVLARQGSDQVEDLNIAVKQSGLAAIENRLENRLETRLGKEFGGTDLSGGQWQKLALARAIYRKADVLILDEPTAALDPRSENEIFQQFTDLSRGRTTILVTHRLGSILMADRIIVMNKGVLTEQGTHQELLDLNGEYAELWQMQASQYKDMYGN